MAAPVTGPPSTLSFLKSFGRNSGALTVSGAASKLATFMVLVLANRSLSKRDFGAYALVLATAEIIRIISAFGVDQVSLRAMSRGTAQAHQILANAIALKMLSSAVAAGVFVAAAWYLRFTDAMWVGFAVMTVDFFLNAVVLSLVTYHQANVRADRAAPGQMIGAAAAFITGLSAFLVHAPMPAFLLSFPVGSLGALVALWLLTRRHVRPSWRLTSRASVRRFAVTAWPIAATGVIVLLYFRISTLMLSKMVGLAAVASYTPAYKVSEAFLLLAGAVSGTTLPILASSLRHGPSPAGVRAYRVSIAIALATSVPFGIFCSVFGSFTLVHLFGASYASSAPALGVLGWATVLMALNMQTTNALLALGRERLILVVSGVNLVTNVVINALLIPRWSFYGSAVATLVTEIVNVGMQAGLVAYLFRATGGRAVRASTEPQVIPK
jgi:O-antigen/teichoic acid export membrane protein